MKFSLLAGSLTLTAIASLAFSEESLAIPNCNSCVPAYQACVAAGNTDCETRYAVCLRWCPVELISEGALGIVKPESLGPTSPSRTPPRTPLAAMVTG